ncbi:MAG: type II toxin-antitoxin system VapC family toxin [Chloroflexi bacterium]|nr:type II toxin-antitoxin system VapC family toxin [Chloroflexota bacterium]
MKPKVYVETTIPSFYYEIRTTPDMVARKEWTRQWWDNKGNGYSLMTSAATLDELNNGNHPNKEAAIRLISSLPLAPFESAVIQIVEAYIWHKVMPNDPTGDALHLALASCHKCDFLLTWNCNHLANANKFGHIRRVNVMLGLFVPMLVTPLELLGG